MSDSGRLNLKLPKWCKAYLAEAAWVRRTSITGVIVELVKQDAEKNQGILLNSRKMLDE